MLNDPKLDRNDSLGVILRSAYSKMNPPPALEKAVRSGIPYTPRANTAIHVRRFAKAIVSYALCVVLLIGGVYLASQLMGGIEPFTSSPSKATTGISEPATTIEPDVTTDPEDTKPDDTENSGNQPSVSWPDFGPEGWYEGTPDVTYHPEVPSAPTVPTVPNPMPPAITIFPNINPTPTIPRPNSPNPWPNNNNPWFYP